jgi:plastocyanin
VKLAWPVTLVAGIAAAFAVAGFPALAAVNHAVSAGPTQNRWNDTANVEIAISVGDTVSWSNSTGVNHNICVRNPGDMAGCNKYLYPNASGGTMWSSPTPVSFDTDNATYVFFCQLHDTSMRGTIKVGNGSPMTTTTTTPGGGGGGGGGTGTTPTPTTTTQTTTTPTPTTTTTETATTMATAPDTVKPRFVGAIKRTGAKLSLSLSESASVTALVERKALGAKKFKKVARKTVRLAAGKRSLKLASKLKKGSYRVTLVLTDAVGNKSRPKVLKFKQP